MPTAIEKNATKVLIKVVEEWQSKGSRSGHYIEGDGIRELANLEPAELNVAVDLLEANGYLEVLKFIGSSPYTFGGVKPTSFGIYQSEKIQTTEIEKDAGAIRRLPEPIGSPYGFTDRDWELVLAEKAKTGQLKVVFGHQFESETYDSHQLIKNIEEMFTGAVIKYNTKSGEDIRLNFVVLKAGYGEHLFNEIVRDIISSDIAIFDTSDMNPNVMLEMGVALTWGIRVLPIKRQDKPKPPSDISGQTWADYTDNGDNFPDEEHTSKLDIMVERTILKKR